MNAENRPDWEKLVRRMELLLRLKSFPVAFKMLADKAELEKIPFLRRHAHKSTLCQLITQVRSFDWTVGADLDDFLFAVCPSILGLCETPETHADGSFRSIVWVRTKEDGRRFEEAIPRLPLNQYQAVAMAPLVYKPFEPDLALIYANPAQMMLLINALQFEDYQPMQFFCVGESSCSDAIVRCLQDGKPSLTIPCYGERRYGHAQDDELVMAIPAGLMPKALRGLEALYRRGVRYPISYAGAESDASQAFPPAYAGLGDLRAKIKGDGRRLVVGLTGGIACGKTTAADMLVELGAGLIDFDLLARQVVEPGEPAYDEIVEYFGKQVLQEDGTLDRKALSAVVFADLEKRKKLEGFTHPRIYQEFFRQIEEIAAREARPVIVADVPLLIELNLGYLFDKIIVVAISPEEQTARLRERDGISEEEARAMLKAQLPIGEKAGFADFVIHNGGTVEETRAQVEKVWAKLQGLREQL